MAGFLFVETAQQASQGRGAVGWAKACSRNLRIDECRRAVPTMSWLASHRWARFRLRPAGFDGQAALPTSAIYSSFPRHSGQPRPRLSPEPITTIGSMDPGSRCARPGMTTGLSNDRSKHSFSLSRRIAPESVQEIHRPIEQGRREGRALAAPVVCVQKSTRSSPQVWPKTPGLPRAMVWRLIRDLPGDRLSCPHHPRHAWRSAANLASAPGCQDHAISPSHLKRSSA
jgi:hypothetical protein